MKKSTCYRYASLFCRRDRLFVQPYHETTDGVLLGGEPVESLEPSSSDQELGEAILRSLGHSKIGVPHPTNWSVRRQHPSVALLSCAFHKWTRSLLGIFSWDRCGEAREADHHPCDLPRLCLVCHQPGSICSRILRREVPGCTSGATERRIVDGSRGRVTAGETVDDLFTTPMAAPSGPIPIHQVAASAGPSGSLPSMRGESWSPLGVLMSRSGRSPGPILALSPSR